MDFIKRLTRQLSRQTSVPKVKQYTLKDVASHCTEESCWMVINDRVYDVTDFLGFHPAGIEIMLEHAGTDASTAFLEKGHSLDAVAMLDKYLIGELVKDDRMKIAS